MIERPDKTKEYRTDWENLKVTDFIFMDCDRSFCSVGNFGYEVIEITDKYIKIENGEKYKKEHPRILCNNPVSKIYLAYFQSK